MAIIDNESFFKSDEKNDLGTINLTPIDGPLRVKT